MTKKNGCGCGSKKNVQPIEDAEIIHNKYYYEKNRNSDANQTISTTMPGNPIVNQINPKMLLSKDELAKYKDKKAKSNSDDFGLRLIDVTRGITELLMLKNKAYGNTALNPTNIFSKLNATEAICARIDDKLSRIGNKGLYDETEDTVDDLIGYLLLLKMAMKAEK